ncbi:hydrogenase large subunit [Lachnoclostridium sp. Marseille-P6806]|uniref:hydrogenase large subunit n=1 Tax=Lachnoclostridium sp. Marseille-P6806 TaxID=2364793 RepID=UPI00102F98BB|nr:nickel-dependent hydrogenase large subunit [Lachnoclostridium sp. Marseille-P6806]
MSYIIPIGPYHPALEEPVHARLVVDGERITDARVFIGYNHRGIEKLAQERNFIQTIVLVERVCGICSHSHAMTYAMCVENIAGVEVPVRGQYIRVMTSELERIHSHLLWLGIACHIVGHDSLFMQIWKDRERTMDTLERLSGNRVNYAMNIIGGVRRDIDDAMRKDILEAMDDLEERMKPITHFLTTDRTLALRTKGVGVLTTEDAERIGAVGPHARASGIDMDVRRDAPYSSYDKFTFSVPVQKSCDVYARVVIRVLEIYESIRIIRQAVEGLPEGPVNLGVRLPKVPAGRCTLRYEAPRGHLVYQVCTDGGPNNYRVSIHVPTFKNAPTVPVMLRGNTVADAGLIVASIDPCFSCMDR